MLLDPSLFESVKRPEGRSAVLSLYETLRDLILTGRLQPGTILNQVELAKLCSVSRTPIREALRMLQEAGLVSAEPNYRSRVLGFDPVDVEALYMRRIVLESLAVGQTTLASSAEDAANLRRIVMDLEGETARTSFPAWLNAHREFHRYISRLAGDALLSELSALELRSEQYISALRGIQVPGWWMRGQVEHREILHAIEAADARRAGELAARHLARTALELLAIQAPEYDTSKIRATLQYALGGSASLSAESDRAKRKQS